MEEERKEKDVEKVKKQTETIMGCGCLILILIGVVFTFTFCHSIEKDAKERELKEMRIEKQKEAEERERAKNVRESYKARQRIEAEEKANPMLVTAKDLLEAYERNAIAAAGTYKDRWVLISGVVTDVDQIDKYKFLILEDPENTEPIIGIQCFFNGSNAWKLEELEVGQEIKVLGKVGEKPLNLVILDCTVKE